MTPHLEKGHRFRDRTPVRSHGWKGSGVWLNGVGDELSPSKTVVQLKADSGSLEGKVHSPVRESKSFRKEGEGTRMEGM